MPGIDISRGDENISIEQRSDEMTVETVQDYEFRKSEVEEPIILSGTTVILKGDDMEIKLFPKDLEKIKSLMMI